MIDRYGRAVRDIRISVNDSCNQRCLYCHEEGNTRSQNHADGYLSPKTIEKIVQIGVKRGIQRVKLTGGEPLLRKEIVEIVRRISSISEIFEVSMTTNGTHLTPELARKLKSAGLKRVNISLDSLSPETYERITGKNQMLEAKNGILAAYNAGIQPIKINVVLLKGINEEEIWDLTKFATQVQGILQLIEIVSLGKGEITHKSFRVDIDHIVTKIEKRAKGKLIRKMHGRPVYQLKDGAQIEIVHPYHNSEFCRLCPRIRLSSDGQLKACLMTSDNVKLNNNSSSKEIDRAFVKVLEMRRPYYTAPDRTLPELDQSVTFLKQDS